MVPQDFNDGVLQVQGLCDRGPRVCPQYGGVNETQVKAAAGGGGFEAQLAAYRGVAKRDQPVGGENRRSSAALRLRSGLRVTLAPWLDSRAPVRCSLS